MMLLGGMGTIFGPVVGAFVDRRARELPGAVGVRRNGSRSSPGSSSSSACSRSAAASSASSAPGGRSAALSGTRRCALRRLAATLPLAARRGARPSWSAAPAATACPTASTSCGCRTGGCASSGPSPRGGAPGRSCSGRRRRAHRASIPYDDDLKVGTVAVWYAPALATADPPRKSETTYVAGGCTARSARGTRTAIRAPNCATSTACSSRRAPGPNPARRCRRTRRGAGRRATVASDERFYATLEATIAGHAPRCE